ncbi:MAG TPA: bifunctional oligoribonuclease/PAP phosphatase NrnA [Candidatus Polarisedimenticolia bacterium]|nr:bifunctional oligoribonuclease/PAP phosphatase NrnA [Candidatus Polarisedimenticolia bacterium]
MTPEIIARIRQALGGAGRILLTTHQNPDGDGLGSQVALTAYLRSIGKEVVILNPDPVPERYRFLDPEGTIRSFEEPGGAELLRGCQLIVTLDNSSLHRLGKMEQSVRESGLPSVCIDHHSTTDAFWGINAIDESACATGEMIFDLIVALGGRPDRASAAALYTAMVTDTGNFRFSKTSPRSHRIAAELLSLGVDPAGIYELVYEQQPEGFIRLMGMALAKFRLEADGRLGWIALNRREMIECSAEQADTSEIVNHLFAIRGVRACLLFKELPDGKVKVSFRSKGSIDVHAVASSYGGGGHQNASGAVVDGPLEGAIGRVVADVRAILP